MYDFFFRFDSHRFILAFIDKEYFDKIKSKHNSYRLTLSRYIMVFVYSFWQFN